MRLSSITIESGSEDGGFGLRRISVTGFRSTFILAKIFVEDTRFYNYVVMEEASATMLVTARSVHNALWEFHRFLRPLEQCDIDTMITATQEEC